MNKLLTKKEYEGWLVNDRKTRIYVESKTHCEIELGWMPDGGGRLPLLKYYGVLFRAWEHQPSIGDRKTKWSVI